MKKFLYRFFQVEEALAEQKQELLPIFDTIDKTNWMQVFSACLGKMMVIQNSASDNVVKGRGWQVDFENGKIAFGDDKYPVQVIGTESTSSNTWMWGWNNINNLSDDVTELTNEMKTIGEKWKLDALRTSHFDLNDVFNGHTLSVVACGLGSERCFYYRGPYHGGYVFMAVQDVPKVVFEPIGIRLFADITIECIKQYPVDHKIFAESLLQWNKTEYEWDGDTLIARFPYQPLYITFEQAEGAYRITAMKTQ